MKEEKHEFESVVLGNRRSIWIRVPRELTADTDLMIILDAELYRDWVDAPKIIEEMLSKKKMREPLIVYVSSCSVEVRGKECPCFPPFVTFISEELLPWIQNRYPAVKQAKERVIAGLSYTGLAASYVALVSKGLFTKVISQSGSYWSNDCWLPMEIGRIAQDSKAAFFLDVGDKETDVKVHHKIGVFQAVSQIEGVERMRDALLENGHSAEYEVFSGGHAAEGWASSLPRALQWALPPEDSLEARASSSC